MSHVAQAPSHVTCTNESCHRENTTLKEIDTERNRHKKKADKRSRLNHMCAMALQHTATHTTTQRSRPRVTCTAECCGVCCSVLQCVAVCCSVLQCHNAKKQTKSDLHCRVTCNTPSPPLQRVWQRSAPTLWGARTRFCAVHDLEFVH